MNNEEELEEILNLKVYRDDFEKILIAIVAMIKKLNKEKNNAVDTEDKERIEFSIYKYKALIDKLRICELYNK